MVGYPRLFTERSYAKRKRSSMLSKLGSRSLFQPKQTSNIQNQEKDHFCMPLIISS